MLQSTNQDWLGAIQKALQQMSTLSEGIINPVFVNDKEIQYLEKKIHNPVVLLRGMNKEEQEQHIQSEMNRIYEKIKPKMESALKEFQSIIKKEISSFKNPNIKFYSQIKSLSSVMDKAVTRKKGFTNINDLVRGAVLFPEQEQAEEFVKDMRRKHPSLIVGYEEKMKGGDKLYGYFGSHHLDLKIGGFIVELQVMTKKLWSYKEVGHQIYNQYRSSGKTMTKQDVALSKKIFSLGNVPGYRKEDLDISEEELMAMFTEEELADFAEWLFVIDTTF